MTTLEEVIFKTCAAIGVDYETIRSDIKFYDFEHPDANRMMIVVDIHSGTVDNSFYMAIPSVLTVKESSYSHYYHGSNSYSRTRIVVNSVAISSYSGNYGEGAFYRNYDLPVDQKNTIELRVSGSGSRATGVGWVLVYQA